MYRNPAKVAPILPTDDEYRRRDAARLFNKYLHHLKTAAKLMDEDEVLLLAFQCGWQANQDHKRTFLSFLEEALDEYQQKRA